MTELDWDVKPDLSELAHHGVKGMHWGVRTGGIKSRAKNAVDDSFQRRIVSNSERAAGNGKARDYFRSAVTTPTGLIPSKKIAARRVRILKDRRERFNQGQATVGDYLSAVGHTHPADLLVSRRDKRGADAKDGKDLISTARARKEAGEKYVKSKENAQVMATKLSDARKDKTATG